MQHPLNSLTQTIIGAALEVHRELGPGMLENAYGTCLTFELLRRDLAIERQKLLPLTYKGQLMDCGYRLDLLVEGSVIVEIKSIEKLDRVHFAQLHSYLRLARCQVGLLFNFNVAWPSRGGIRRIVHDVALS
jgi:GxxExxY protein